MKVKALDKSLMKIKTPPNQVIQGPKLDLDKTSSEKPLKGLVRPAHKLIKLITEKNSKVQEVKINNKTIFNSVHENRW